MKKRKKEQMKRKSIQEIFETSEEEEDSISQSSSESENIKESLLYCSVCNQKIKRKHFFCGKWGTKIEIQQIEINPAKKYKIDLKEKTKKGNIIHFEKG